MKKILFFLIDMNLGGTEKSFLNLISELPTDYEIDLLLLEKKGELLNQLPGNVNLKIIENGNQINEFINLGCRRYAFNELKRGNLISFLKNIFVFTLYKINILKHPYYGIANLINDQPYSYDTAAAYAGPHDFISYYLLNSTKAKKKIQWIHFDVTRMISNPNFGKRFYPKFDEIYCVSQNAKEVFVKMFPAVAAQTIVFENIVSVSELEKQAANGESFTDDFNGIRILTLGRLSKEKGQNMIPNVAAKLKKDGFQFRWYLIGDGKLREEIEQQIKNLHLENELVLLGAQLNPYPFLRDCNLFVQTSLHEGYCITLQEAKAFKKPVVTTHFLSADNLIAHEKDGLIVEISEEGIYQGVKKLLGNPELIGKFSVSNFKQQNIQGRIEEVFGNDE